MENTSEQFDANYSRRSGSKSSTKAQKTSFLLNIRDKWNKKDQRYTSTYHLVSEIMRREHGLCGDGQHSLRNGLSDGFEKRFCGSRHVVDKLKLLYSIQPGNGVYQHKTLCFRRVGSLLCCNSPISAANTLQVWDWNLNKLKFSFESGPALDRISDLKFLEINDNTNIVSISSKGHMVLTTISPSGGEIRSTVLHKREYSSCKLALCPENPFAILSAGIDGLIILCDIRISSAPIYLKTVIGDKHLAQLFSISHHPFQSELCVSCDDNYIRVYDLRNMTNAVHKMCPQKFIDEKYNCLTCTAVYNSTGSEILGSYSYDDNYLFNNKAYVPGSFVRRYTGHYQIRVSYSSNAKFFGPHSEYVISSSEFGSICIWDKSTGKIIDIIGDVIDEDLFEAHPSLPILASWGRCGGSIKIWSPMNEVRRKSVTCEYNGSYSDLAKPFSFRLLG